MLRIGRLVAIFRTRRIWAKPIRRPQGFGRLTGSRPSFVTSQDEAGRHRAAEAGSLCGAALYSPVRAEGPVLHSFLIPGGGAWLPGAGAKDGEPLDDQESR
jgi:hypothetical protein